MHRSSLLPSFALVVASAGCSFFPSATVTPPPTVDASTNDDGDGGDVVDLPLEVVIPDVMLPTPDAPKFGEDAVTTSLDANCGAITHMAKMLPADILLVQDRSLSMTNDQNDKPCTGGTGLNGNCGANSKWSQVTTALDQVMTTTDTMVNWGLLYFGAETTQCGVTMAPAVPIASMNGTAIGQAFVGQPATTGQVGTPTRAAINNAVTYMNTLTDPNPKYLLLATDGQPNCGTTAGLNTDDSVGSEQAVTDALTAGYSTFVVGIGNTGGTAVLNAMAINGGKPVPGAPGGNSFYQVNNTADLETALGQILGTVTTCVFDIGPPPNDQTSVDKIVVFGDGTQIGRDGANGWDFSNTDKTQVTLYGSSCDAVTKGTIKSVAVTFGCIVS
ncbi:MAG TPA: vWA domain-containing protein [Polyangia bacterium]|jgi:hypothetical protein